MNIEELNSCFDSITPTKEQKDKMLAGIMKAKAQPVKTINLYRYVSAAAAVIVIGIFVGVYSNINTNTNTGVTDVALGTKTSEVQKTTKIDITAEPNKSTEKNTQNPENDKTNMINNIKNEYIGNDEKVSKDYEIALEVCEEDVLPAAPQENETVTESNILEDYENNTLVASTDSAYIPASGGGGGASGGGSASYTRSKSLTLNEIRSNEIYSLLLPSNFVEGFGFTGATETDKNMYAYFSSADGSYMEISVVKKDEVKIYQQIISPSQIVDITTDGYMDFAVDCGDYYVLYYIECDDSSDVYEMVTSSAYFK